MKHFNEPVLILRRNAKIKKLLKKVRRFVKFYFFASNTNELSVGQVRLLANSEETRRRLKTLREKVFKSGCR